MCLSQTSQSSLCIYCSKGLAVSLFPTQMAPDVWKCMESLISKGHSPFGWFYCSAKHSKNCTTNFTTKKIIILLIIIINDPIPKTKFYIF
uniref:Uncharacterized protein n=1 Tax=Anguilla anguilla TaxID=7936 RepID=A0A0E9XN33_ANGAN